MIEPSFPFEIDHLIEYYSEDIDFSLPKEEEVTKWLNGILEAEQKELDSITYVFCKDEYLLSINQTYLKHDDFTDIITFPYNRNPVEGDVFISVERASENATTYKVELIDEIHRLLVHGLLHLVGYDDKDVASKEKMTSLENLYLSKRTFVGI